MQTKIKTCDIKRKLPEWAKVTKVVNGVQIYNMNIFDNIMSWNQYNSDVPAFDYYGTVITYGELPERVNEYVNAFQKIGINKNSVVTLCLPVSIENMLSLFAIDIIGGISNNVNFLFLKNDFKCYTQEKGSDTLIILDAYLPSIVDCIEECNIKNIIVTSLKDNLSEDKKDLFNDLSRLPSKIRELFDVNEQKKCREKLEKLKGVTCYRLPMIISHDELEPLPCMPVDIERDVSYSYTSGTTGKPKCIVYKESSANAFIEMHAGLDTKDYVGERVFQVIPLTHATGERVSGYLQMAKGKTLVPQPIYNKDSFGEDLRKSRCNWVVAAPSFYLAAVAQGVISSDALKNVTRPSSGGEPVTKACVIKINEWLEMNGCQVKFAIGGGAAEDGSGTLFTYFMNEQLKTNETGIPLEPGIYAKIVDDLGYVVKKGERGSLHISSCAAADRYLNDGIATKARWYYDENGIRWGITGDIAVQNDDGSYNILGRASDSYFNNEGKKIYLFDIEYSLEHSDGIIEWEITAHKTQNGVFVVGQVIMQKEIEYRKAEMVEYLCKKYNLDAIKYYKTFDISDVTGKRDYQKLKDDKVGYYAPYDESNCLCLDFSGNEVISKVVSKDEVV